MNEQTKNLIQLDKNYLWHPFTQMADWLKAEPVIIDSAEGFYLIDTQGKRYIDGVSSLWCNVHGHKVKKIDDAIKAQLNKIAHSTLLGLAQTKSIELAEKLLIEGKQVYCLGDLIHNKQVVERLANQGLRDTNDLRVSIRYVVKNPESEQAIRDSYLATKVILKSLGRWMSNASAADRTRNSVSVFEATGAVAGPVREEIGEQGTVTSAVVVILRVRDAAAA